MIDRFKVVCFWVGDNFRRGAEVLRWSCCQFGIACSVTEVPTGMEQNQLMKYKTEIIIQGQSDGQNVLYVDADAYIKDGRTVRRLLNSEQFRHIDCAWHMFTPANKRCSDNNPRFGGLKSWPAGGTLYIANSKYARRLIYNWRNQWEDHPEYSDQTRLYNAWIETPNLAFYNLPLSWYQMPNDPNATGPAVIPQGWWKKVPGTTRAKIRFGQGSCVSVGKDYGEILKNWKQYVEVLV